MIMLFENEFNKYWRKQVFGTQCFQVARNSKQIQSVYLTFYFNYLFITINSFEQSDSSF